ncbi:hypothetical protein CANARDRAFT_9043 [[Candida] arabinofermentans NRRL YB-2248]|uniref:DUF7907 domain-containing protein n=1 Tax=[Candida] arabinofermentans NRRL YB-2248 TaxID=983967 RepID=A0A1E4SX10_9ASCO|nr:hypothetical protein CANARDRAFT_9043 [[Candida] arabinofermentans NRRL YB-2248]
MRFSVLSSIAITSKIALASLDSPSGSAVSLYVSSSSDEIDGLGIYNIHEGAGINYVFVSTSDSTTDLYYDESDKFIYQPFASGYYQYLSTSSGIVQLTVSGNDGGVYTFDDDGYLLLNGSSDGFYACKNTNDPYRYSQTSYEVMYYDDESKASSCLSLKLQKKASSGSSSASASSSAVASSSIAAASTTAVASVVSTVEESSTVTSTICPSCVAGSVSTSSADASSITLATLEGAAAMNVKPVGFAAAALGVAALLI